MSEQTTDATPRGGTTSGATAAPGASAAERSAGTRGSTTAGAVAVHEQGAGSPLAGPGTGRAVSQPTDARVERRESYDPADFPALTGREEEWRFTPLKRLRGLHDGTAVPEGTVTVEVDAPEPVRVETVGRDDARLGRAGVPVDRVAATAYAGFTKATVVTVPAETEVAEPIRIRVAGAMSGTAGLATTAGDGAPSAAAGSSGATAGVAAVGSGAAASAGATAAAPGSRPVAFGHLQIDVAPLARATVVLEHTGSAILADNVEFVVGDGAAVTVVALYEWADDAVHATQQHALVGRDATFKSVNVVLGGDLVRLVPRVRYAGPGGDANLLGLYFADSVQHLEQRLFVDHAAPHCKSRVTYKGALQGKDAHTVWVGDVLIRATAEGTDTYELNRNLVLTDGARADSVPNLEIETGEVVGAGHASATGRFDDEQLFYLQARGIPEDMARRLVVRGFFAEVIARIGIPEVEERLLAAVEAELAVSVGGVA
jgi:Fe-S cluster assembly protein SufD